MIAIDYETATGERADFRYWRKAFHATSLAAAWEKDGTIRTWFSKEEKEIRDFLIQLSISNLPTIVHNLSFEYGVTNTLYPELEINFASDTMRLAQLLDNGADWRLNQFATEETQLDWAMGDVTRPEVGLSLEAVASRYLPKELTNHKRIAHQWLEDNHGIKTKHGQHLHLLPDDILEAYNIADVIVTLELYKVLTQRHEALGTNIGLDWMFYTTRIEYMVQAYQNGIKIDRERLKDATLAERGKVTHAEQSFRELSQVATGLELKEDFKFGSDKQLREVLVDKAGFTPKHFTPKGKPSFKADYLGDYGEPGKALVQRKKSWLSINQMMSVYMMSEEDGKCHPEVRVSGTRTNRVSGGR